MHLPHWGCVRTLCTLYVYATAGVMTPNPQDKHGIMCAELIVAELRDRFAPVLNNIAQAVNQAKETLNAELYGSRH